MYGKLRLPRLVKPMKKIGSIVLLYPARITVELLSRYAMPTRGPMRHLSLLIPQSAGTPFRPQMDMILAAGLNTSAPAPLRVGKGKYSQRAPYVSVSLGVTCQRSRMYRAKDRVLLKYSSWN